MPAAHPNSEPERCCVDCVIIVVSDMQAERGKRNVTQRTHASSRPSWSARARKALTVPSAVIVVGAGGASSHPSTRRLETRRRMNLITAGQTGAERSPQYRTSIPTPGRWRAVGAWRRRQQQRRGSRLARSFQTCQVGRWRGGNEGDFTQKRPRATALPACKLTSPPLRAPPGPSTIAHSGSATTARKRARHPRFVRARAAHRVGFLLHDQRRRRRRRSRRAPSFPPSPTCYRTQSRSARHLPLPSPSPSRVDPLAERSPRSLQHRPPELSRLPHDTHG